MQFLILTPLRGGDDANPQAFVEIDAITCVEDSQHGSLVRLCCGTALQVRETPKEILESIQDMCRAEE